MFKKLNRNIFFVRHGVHKGEFLVEVDRQDKKRIFLALPDKNIHKVDEEEVEKGLKKQILMVVEKLPRAVYNVCLKEYKLILSEQQRLHTNN